MKIINSIHPLFRQLHCQYPIVSAPMASVAGSSLACAVTKAGGLGFVGVGYANKIWLEAELNKTTPENFAIGFITWQLLQKPELLDVALSFKPRAVMLSFGDVAPFAHKIHAEHIPLICQVQTLKQASEAINAGASAIVAQGLEAGGHGLGQTKTSDLLLSIKKQYPDIPIIAAGGIATGKQMAHFFNLGACSIMMGTRFYASIEANAPQAFKEMLCKKKATDTARTRLFDIARNIAWPKQYDARAIKNVFTESYNENNLNNKEKILLQENYNQAIKNKDYTNLALFAGTGIDDITDILPARAIIDNTINDFNQGN